MNPFSVLLAFAVGAFALPQTQVIHARSADRTCEVLISHCHADAQANPASAPNAFADKSCVLAGACSPYLNGIDGLLKYAYRDNYVPPAQQARLQPTLFSSTPWTEVSYQNFIDAYYGQMATFGGPYPEDQFYLKQYFSRIQYWTGFCGRSIPFFNFADFFQYSTGSEEVECS